MEIAKHFCVNTILYFRCVWSELFFCLLFTLISLFCSSFCNIIGVFLCPLMFKVSFSLLSLPPQEPTHFDADAALIQEDMEVMSDFELHRLCQQYSSISSYQLENSLLLDSGKFHHLTELLASLKNKVNTNVQNRTSLWYMQIKDHVA